MDFDKLVQSVEITEDRELVGLAIYYHDQVKDSAPVDHADVQEIIATSRTKNLSGPSISAHIRYLKEDEMIFSNGQGYKLTNDGADLYRDQIGEKGEKRETYFLEIPHIDDEFYTTLSEDINKSYRRGIDEAVLVLTRKLLENLVIDILRARYGLEDERRELFYNTNKRQFRRFSKLIENIEENMDDLEYFSDRMDESVIGLLNDLKDQGDASAHSIEISPSEKNMIEYRDKANQAVSILSYTLSKVRDSK